MHDSVISDFQTSPFSTALVNEFLRVLGLYVVVTGRGDIHVAHDGANLVTTNCNFVALPSKTIQEILEQHGADLMRSSKRSI